MPQKKPHLSKDSVRSRRKSEVKPRPHIAPIPDMDVSRLSDEELMLRVPQSEPCFRELVERYQRQIYLFSFSLLRSEEDAEDVAQNAFLAVYKNASRFDPTYRFASWIYTIAGNLAKNVFRKRKRERKKVSRNVDDASTLKDKKVPPPGKIVDLKWNRERVAQAVALLDPKYSIVLMLRYGEGCSYAEIGQQLGLKQSAVDTRLFRAKNLLRVELSKLGIFKDPFES